MIEGDRECTGQWGERNLLMREMCEEGKDVASFDGESSGGEGSLCIRANDQENRLPPETIVSHVEGTSFTQGEKAQAASRTVLRPFSFFMCIQSPSTCFFALLFGRLGTACKTAVITMASRRRIKVQSSNFEAQGSMLLAILGAIWK